MIQHLRKAAAALLVAGIAFSLSGCDLGYKRSSQEGARGAGLQQIVDTSRIKQASAVPPPPYPLGPIDGPRANVTYQNVKVLGDLSTDEFNRLMLSITQWVAPPAEGCNYCHNPANMASDEVYRKVVARRMLQMTRNINVEWKTHVKGTGVTCYTCHRGNGVPQYTWTLGAPENARMGIVGNKHGQNTPDPNVGYASLPFDPFAQYLEGPGHQIRVASSSAFPSRDHVVSIKDAEGSYGLMMHLSSALGVNCTYCHNTQSFRSWPESRAQRAVAYYGIRMVRDINANYISSLHDVFPANRKGPQGDPLKANCATCHQGLNKPLGGVSMLPDNPALAGPRGAVTVPANAMTPADAARANGTTQ